VPGVEIGIAMAGVRKANRRDLTVITLGEGAAVAGVFTQNRFCAAPVLVCREHLASSGALRALVINAGNANAGTGARGLADARATCEAVAEMVAHPEVEHRIRLEIPHVDGHAVPAEILMLPTIVDGDFVLYESNAIVEYLDEAHAGRGLALFPGDARKRATVRRIVSEVDSYTTEAVDQVVERLLGVKPEERDAGKLDEARRAAAEEFAFVARYLAGDFLVGPLSAADFALYPAVAFMDRCHQREPSFDAASLMPPALAAWKKRIEALPYLDATRPPHWRA